MNKPLLTLPEKGNPYFNNSYAGGTNPCIVGNKPKGAQNRTGEAGYNVLPNCTGWATAEFNRLAGSEKCIYLGNTNAANYISLAKRQGLAIGSEPKLGACIVWENGSAGHVGIVCKILTPEHIVISQSGWNSARTMWLGDHYKGNGNWVEGSDAIWMKNSYRFLGFIYNPGVEDKEVEYDEFKAHMNRYLAELGEGAASKWAEPALEEMKEKGVMVGDEDGNQRPKSFATREEIAVMLSNLK